MADVNLDALIPREDFDVEAESRWVGNRKESISASDLKKGTGWSYLLRKPDFQRETSEWSAANILDFIESFSNGDLIPAVILWHEVGNHIFVIDGCHRLSALAAWVNDDYGDGEISRSLYGMITPEESRIAKRTKRLVERKIGSYREHEYALGNPENADQAIVQRARRLTSITIKVQYVDGNSTTAETSFKKINQRAAPINKTEIRVLDARRTPLGIASRAIVHAGRGHKYWGHFEQQQQRALESLAADVHGLLFDPPLPKPIDNLDLPMAGQSYAAQSLAVVLEFLEIANDVIDAPPVDLDGGSTIQFIQRAKEVAELINSKDPGSLGLHPAVYFYTSSGQYKPASLYAAAAFVKELILRKKLDEFIAVRRDFERLLVENEYVIQQIVRNHRGAAASTRAVRDFYIRCIDLLNQDNTVERSVDEIIEEGTFGKLAKRAPAAAGKAGAKFSKATKAEILIRDHLTSAVRCVICGGLVHKNGQTVDHDVRRADGGTNDASNGGIAHPYCNTGYKERQVALSRR